MGSASSNFSRPQPLEPLVVRSRALGAVPAVPAVHQRTWQRWLVRSAIKNLQLQISKLDQERQRQQENGWWKWSPCHLGLISMDQNYEEIDDHHGKTDKNHGEIDEQHGTTDENHGKSIRTMENRWNHLEIKGKAKSHHPKAKPPDKKTKQKKKNPRLYKLPSWFSSFLLFHGFHCGSIF